MAPATAAARAVRSADRDAADAGFGHPPASTRASSTPRRTPPSRPASTTARTTRRTVRTAHPGARPRRVSGPARPIAAAAAAAGGAIAIPAPSRPHLPRRPRIAVRRPHVPAPRPRQIPAALIASVRSAPDHRWLDRIVRGRAWIPVLGVLLTLIVGMQVEVLKLGASVGRNVGLVGELQSRNESLRTEVSQLSDSGRIERLAAGYGMSMPGPVDTHFIRASSAGLSAAIAGIRAPNRAAFLANLASQHVVNDGSASGSAASSGGASAAAAAANGTGTAGTTGTAGVAGTAGTAGTVGSAGTAASSTSASGTTGSASAGTATGQTTGSASAQTDPSGTAGTSSAVSGTSSSAAGAASTQSSSSATGGAGIGG